jgi:uncharacterized protein (DUF1778 family)
VEIKTTDAAKDLIRRAAALSGQDMTAFIMASAFERAEQVLERHQRIELSAQAFNRLQAVLAADESAVPTRALIDLMSLDNASRNT